MLKRFWDDVRGCYSARNIAWQLLAAVLTYVRQSFGNKASAITPAQVSAIHAKEADRKEWTQDELLRLP